ncbi:MAG: flagellar filament capping protein FliD [Terracidiphilus sp.]|nr:flagellar filament capping protein FliD [Terracidiphilus sp.]
MSIGLSFGSPTSGEGFDVSSTVASIVSNLKNVETPWKTQLTSLQSEDTVISSLGTLFSNLSNDMSTLTDFTGIMAQKEGSSSDTSVLTLTAADSTAVAGTHTVSVTNLAQTSSGYLEAVASASTVLTGSITLQVGTDGTAQTFTLNSTNNTLTTLAKAINASGVGITASVLTDSSGARLSLVSGTSGANGNITVSANSISTVLGYTASTTSGNSTGTLASITNASDKLSGSMTIQVGNGTKQNVVIGDAPSTGTAANTIYVGSSANTLSTLADAINAQKDTLGVTASVVTSTDGTTSSLQLVSNTATSTGNLTVVSSIADASTSALAYTAPVEGKDAVLTVNGVKLTSSSNTVTNLIAGVTFQLTAPSPKESDGTYEQVQVVIANDNSSVESAFKTVVSDYNSLLSAMNAQEGLDSSNNAEPLFGSPTLSMLQQQLLSGLNLQNPSGYLDSVSSTTGTTLSGSIDITLGSGTTQKFVIGTAPTDPPADTFYTGSSSLTLQQLADAINTAAAGTSLSYTAATSTDSSSYSTGTLSSITDASLALSGSISIAVGSGTKHTFTIGSTPSAGAATNTTYTGDGVDTLAELADAINSASLGVKATVVTPDGGVSTLSLTSTTAGTAGTLSVSSSLDAAGTGITAKVSTKNGQSSLSLLSQTTGSNGVLAVTSDLTATSDTALSFTTTAGTATSTSTTTSTATLTGISNASDILTGSVTIKVGSSGTAQTISLPTAGGTLSDLMKAINNAKVGVTASISTNSSNQSVLSLKSGTAGTDGSLTLTSSILDTSNTTTASLSYTNSSDVGSIGSLGISMSNDGTMSLDVASLDSILNSDFSGVVGFFQNSNSWGQSFSTMLTNAGTTSSTGILKLASVSNSNIESTLNAEISREESMISAQQVSLTAELNSANEIMQALPNSLKGISQLYSAITGYNQSS